ncbi:ATP-binding protein [Candidatus Margulisiibacteriota bacterium]
MERLWKQALLGVSQASIDITPYLSDNYGVMYERILNPISTNSFFLFGARGTGKTTFLKNYFSDKATLWFDLLDLELEDEFSRNPNSLHQRIDARQQDIDWVVIDEIQKVPKLLDLVHQYIEKASVKFALTGSSARKLKSGASNLLAGRAFVNHLFPLTASEMGNKFNLDTALNWGLLPQISHFSQDNERAEFLRAYGLTYLKEEVWGEQLVKNMDPFRNFLEIAAQSNTEIINYTNIARDIGIDTKTVQSYFEILADTLLGCYLEPYHKSIRKQQRQSPKFYFFDMGVTRALNRQLTSRLLKNSLQGNIPG